ncbi:hypothetical protein [Psychroflexus aestuariivivens]|uniref:hypothetical protein n=1 Tax=Psychroflexus aestuariivivens TaxID=1795040 RepID=UPI000FD93F96|nr:hypothetical protein [Psychroflexus aestuariivivens]
MKYLKINIPSYVLPETKYTLDKGVYIFPSNINQPSKIIDKVYLSLIITDESLFLINSDNLKICVSSFIVFLNFITYSVHSAIWLQTVNFKVLYKEVSEADSLNEIVENYMEFEKSQINYFYHNFNYLALQIGTQKSDSDDYANFVYLYRKYINLDYKDPLKDKIDLLSFTSVQPNLTNNYYDNQNVEISLVYTILDSIIKDYLKDNQTVKKCENCGFKKIGRKNDKTRISEFIDLLEIEDPKLWKSILMNLYRIRNEFFHEGKIDNLNENIDKAFKEKLNDTKESGLTIKEEVKYNQSRLLGLLKVKMMIRKILIESLKKQV